MTVKATVTVSYKCRKRKKWNFRYFMTIFNPIYIIFFSH